MTKEDLIENLFQTFNMMMCEHKVLRSYGTTHKLSFSEISLLKCVGRNTNSKSGDLSALLGMTNGAVTQNAKKLIDKQYLIAYQAEGNRKEVFYKLTKEGLKACEGYDEHYKDLKNNIYNYLKKLSDLDVENVNGLFETIIKKLSLEKSCSLGNTQHENCESGRCEKCKRVY